MFDLVGQDVSAAKGVIQTIKRLTRAARDARIKVIYLTMGYAPDLSESGGPGSPNWYKEFGLAAMNKHPEYKGKFLIRGSWDADIVDELKPASGDIVVQSHVTAGSGGRTSTWCSRPST